VSAFFDTNILVYAYSTDPKRARAQALVAEGGIISAQVLNEFTSVLRTKQKQDWPIIEAAIRSVRFQFNDILPLTVDTHEAAIALARAHGFSFYDALIAAAAIEANCDILYSEDFQHGRTVGGLTIRNPFIEGAP
jgi:predicted nucleic acid-binding protein